MATHQHGMIVPCPWCQGRNLDTYDLVPCGSTGPLRAVACEDCGATGPPQPTKKQAKVTWCNRAVIPGHPVTKEGLAALVGLLVAQVDPECPGESRILGSIRDWIAQHSEGTP